jgi:hypothetical protein
LIYFIGEGDVFVLSKTMINIKGDVRMIIDLLDPCIKGNKHIIKMDEKHAHT